MAKAIKRLINVTDLINAINDELYMDESTKAAFRSIVYQQPLVDNTPVVHGRWDDFCNGKMCCCSVCKAEFDNTCNDIHGEWKFCPNCSAKMDGGVSDG